jgi:hypothetical protein
VKSFSPAGMTQKGYFGRGARSFGNPDGATRGGGAYAAGGANPNGPNQGGGGATPTLVITAGSGGGTGYEQTFCGVPVFGALVSGAPPATVITPLGPYSIGQDVANLGPLGFSLEAFGAVAQNAFTSVEIIQLGVTLTTATADFWTNGGGCGPSTIWTWLGSYGFVVGHNYGFVFV